jgi:hypothetical protein
MTRLDRVLKLLEKYDGILAATLSIANDTTHGIVGYDILVSLRNEKDQLTQELIEHGCRRKN